MNFETFEAISKQIRETYKQLEIKHHGTPWTIEEDALAFLTDAGLVGRYTMSRDGRWPSDQEKDLTYKIGECAWWLAVLAQRSGLSFEDCIQEFLEQKKHMIQENPNS